MRTCICGATIVTAEGLLEDHHILIVDGRIAVISPRDQLAREYDAEIVDATGMVVGPGFVDIHCHGGDGRWFHDDPRRAARFHLDHGTTSLLGTTILHATAREQIDAVESVASAALDPAIPNVVGVNMEGPFLNPDLGAYKEYSRPPERGEYLEYVRVGRGALRWMTIAPEVCGVSRMVDDLQVATRGEITFSVGHSRARHEEIRALLPNGLRIATHLMNATGAPIDPPEYEGTREVGVDESVLVEPSIAAEVIADSQGCHVRPDHLRLIYRVKGRDRTVLVTDCTAESGSRIAGGPPDVNFNRSGGLAGSSLTMDRAVANFARHTGIGLAEAWRLGSFVPARLMGGSDLGDIAPGFRANLVFAAWDGESLTIRDVWIDGVSTGGRHV